MVSITRHALLLVFEYPHVHGSLDPPVQLLSMEKDLANVYKLCRDRLTIPESNITVVTDLRIRRGQFNPWDPLSDSPSLNPSIIRLRHPDATRVCREVAQFVENTVRGIMESDYKSKGEQVNEVFLYISGHGALVPDVNGKISNALLFTSKDGKRREYLHNEHIFKLLFGHLPVDKSGVMDIPVTYREKEIDSDGSYSHVYKTKVNSIKLVPSAHDRQKLVNADDEFDKDKVVATTPRGRHHYLSDRGLPSDVRLLVCLDTCHAGSMTDFHWMYDSWKDTMRLKKAEPPSHLSYPICICISSSCDKSESPSTSIGSLFTNHLCSIFNRLKGTTSIKGLHALLYRNLPYLLHSSRPTITATVDDKNYPLPLLHSKDIKISSSQE